MTLNALKFPRTTLCSGRYSQLLQEQFKLHTRHVGAVVVLRGALTASYNVNEN